MATVMQVTKRVLLKSRSFTLMFLLRDSWPAGLALDDNRMLGLNGGSGGGSYALDVSIDETVRMVPNWLV